MNKRRFSNWVDRGESPDRQLTRVLVRFLGLDPKADAATLAAHCATIIAFVAADGSEVQLADYLAELQRGLERDVSPGNTRRYVAIALWHIAKVALLREEISHRAAADPPTSASISLSEWLAHRLGSNDD
ncbi:MAG TPA: hypothetical protein VGD27_11135 [Longimicrobiales bacterium]